MHFTLFIIAGALAATETSQPIADTNADGIVTRTEFVAFRTARMFEFDADQDGFLSFDEFRVQIPKRVPKWVHKKAFNQFDTDKDELVSEEEALNGPAKVFDDADRNGDDQLTGDELQELRDKLSSEVSTS